ncbi:hypothetical protein HD554DRAFT_2179280 [Boletus coccyginus]|nr:hypothetical protein HD554DRAFT_2179280 [Boletus coccyginus]
MPENLLDPISGSSQPGLVHLHLSRLAVVSYSTEAQTRPSSSQNKASDDDDDLLASNFEALVSRFIQLSRRPRHLAPVILDFCSLSLSLILTAEQPGPDLLYPFSSLKKLKSGRLARLLLEHSRDLPQRNLHDASSPRNGVDPPRAAVIDLGEVSPEIIERGYTVSADFYGFVVMVLLLETLISPVLHILSPSDIRPYYKWISGWSPHLLGHWVGGWLSWHSDLLSRVTHQWTYTVVFILLISFYAVLEGEGTLTLVRRSDVRTPGCAVLLDRDFTLILIGTQDIVEAIAESSFRTSHTLAGSYRLEAWEFARRMGYEALEALCQGVPFAILAGFWLVSGPTSFQMAVVPVVPPMVISLVAYIYTIRDPDRVVQERDVDFNETPAIICFFGIVPTLLLIFTYELARVKDHVLRSWLQPTAWLHFVPVIFLAIHYISSQNCRIRTAKFLDILGHPPVRRWEFDTLAATATFQCLVLCHDIPRPIRSIDVLTLLDTFVPDQRDVWKVWKARVADRIAHEEDVSFAPTLPSFGDQRQKHLKGLLDQAQIGYDVYKSSYHRFDPQTVL